MLATELATQSARHVVAGVRRSALLAAITGVCGLGLAVTTMLAPLRNHDGPNRFANLSDLPFLTLPTSAWVGIVVFCIGTAFIYQQVQLDVLRWLLRAENEHRFSRFWVWRLERHRHQWNRLEDVLYSEQTYDSVVEIRRLKRRLDMYPKQPENIRSTLLANLLTRAEEGPWLGVELDLAVVGPPLLTLLSASERAAIDEPREELDASIGLMLALCLTSAGSAACLAVLVALRSGAWLSAAMFLTSLLAISVVGALGFYRKALRAAVSYKDGIDITFLLYRYRLLDNLDLGRPDSLNKEPALFNEAAHLIQRNQMHKKLDFTGAENSEPDRNVEFRRPNP